MHRVAFVTVVLAALYTAVAPAGAAEAPKEILVGTTMSLTGTFSLSAEKWGKMTEVFEQVVNARGGVMLRDAGKKVPVKFIYYDDKSVPATAVQMFERLATVDNVHVLVGPDWSPIGNAASNVADKHQLPMLMANVLSPQIYARGYQWVFGTPMPGVEVWSDKYFDLLAQQKPAPKTVAFFYADQPFARDVPVPARKKAESLGMQAVAFESFPPELKDFSSLLLKAKPLNPDILYISAFEEAIITVLRQVRDLDLNPRNIHTVMTSGKVIKAMGKEAELLTGEAPWWYGMKTPKADLVEEVLKKSNVDIRDYIWTMSRLISYMIMLDAIEKAGGLDRAKIRDALRASTFEMPIGPIKFEKDGHAINPGYPTQVQKGDLVILAPANLATGKFLYPSPPWKERK